jgi:hypothetical protein
MSIEDIKKPLETDLSATGREYADNAYILDSDSRRDYIDIGITELVSRKTISILFVFMDHSTHIAYSIASKGFKDLEIAD